MFSGDLENSRDYLSALELLSSLRLCSNVAGQWAVQTALGGYQSIKELVRPGGRLYESRKAIVDAVARSNYLTLTRAAGRAVRLRRRRHERLPGFDDRRFAMDLLEHKHVLVAPGTSFNVRVQHAFPRHQPAGTRGARPTSSAAWRSCSTTTRPATNRFRGRRRCGRSKPDLNKICQVYPVTS